MKYIGVAERMVPQLMFTLIDVQSLGAGEMPFIWLNLRKGHVGYLSFKVGGFKRGDCAKGCPTLADH
jgi:hypothetical protein